MFERFVRSSGDRGGSTGLGLAIVRAVTEAHGGEVRLEDAEPGARFIVSLPRIHEPAGAPDDLRDEDARIRTSRRRRRAGRCWRGRSGSDAAGTPCRVRWPEAAGSPERRPPRA